MYKSRLTRPEAWWDYTWCCACYFLAVLFSYNTSIDHLLFSTIFIVF